CGETDARGVTEKCDPAVVQEQKEPAEERQSKAVLGSATGPGWICVELLQIRGACGWSRESGAEFPPGYQRARFPSICAFEKHASSGCGTLLVRLIPRQCCAVPLVCTLI